MAKSNLHLYIVTFNCGRAYIDEDVFANELFNGLSSSSLPDIIVLSLQEIAPISESFIGGKSLIPYWQRFHHAVQKAARTLAQQGPDDQIYKAVRAQNVGMTGLMLFARNEASIQNLEYAGVGLGVANMGNKSAVGMRLTYRDGDKSSELTFVAAHLAPHEWALKRRNEDWKNIGRRLIFSSNAQSETGRTSALGEERPLLSLSSRDATIYKPTSHLFVAGDLNYRTSIISPSPTDHVDSFPQPYHEKSSPQHFSNYFKNDQLTQEIAAGRTCHGLSEAKVTFPPTYKYNPELTSSDTEKWNWAKHRWPSWCDRILYRSSDEHDSSRISSLKYSALPIMGTSDHRPVALELSIPLVTTSRIANSTEDSEGPFFSVDIDWKTKRDRALQLEWLIGYTLYLTSTSEGAMMLLALVAGVFCLTYGIRTFLL